MKVTSQLYGQFLLSSQINYTGTYLADHVEGLDHNSIYRYLKNEKLTPKLIWENVKDTIIYSSNGKIIFDDCVLPKKHSRKIEGSKTQYAGCEKGLVRGIGIVNCVYYNPDTKEYWVIDYRIYDPPVDGKSKLDHMKEMLDIISHRKIIFSDVLMDTWYATAEMMMIIHKMNKRFYCPIKQNRNVDDKIEPSQVKFNHVQVQKLTWSNEELKHGKVINIKGLNLNLKLFQIVLNSKKTELIVTNDLTQNSTDDCQEEVANRWKIEEFHREEKQLTGIGKCECRLNRSQRNHIYLAMLVWVRLKNFAKSMKTTIYRVKNRLLDEYMVQQMRNPSIVFEAK
jgi:hypothetical protein